MQTCQEPRSPGSTWCAAHRALYCRPPTAEQIARAARDAKYYGQRRTPLLTGSAMFATRLHPEGAGATSLSEFTPERATAGDIGGTRRRPRIAEE